MLAKQKQLAEDGVTQTVQTRGRGGNSNFPNVISGAKGEDIRRCMTNCLRWYGKPLVKSDDECRQRLYDFFIECQQNEELPTVEKMCMALGTVRQVVWQWENGQGCSAERTDLIKKAKEFIATFESEMVTEGKIQPVVYIFRAKNYFGLKDQQEITLRPDQPLGSEPDQKALEDKIIGSIVSED